jgi:peptidyl-Lys metalloendopeptidase
MNRLLALALLAIFSIHCTKAAVTNADAEPLECKLDSVHPLVAGGPVALRFRLTNRTAEPIWILRWNTPFEGWRGTLFTVTANGTEIPYQGPMVKRGDPVREDYVEIPAGESVSASVDLAEAYEIRQPGLYDVKVTGNLLDVAKGAASLPRPRDRHEPMALRCEGITLDVKAAS